MSALIEFDEVCKYYQMGDTTVKAADHITMKIDKGEFVAIVGQSGSGILSGMTMVFVPAVSTFYISQKLGGTDTVLIGDVIERQFKQGNNPNLGAALSLVLMILVFICTGIMNRFGGGNEEGGVIV